VSYIVFLTIDISLAVCDRVYVSQFFSFPNKSLVCFAWELPNKDHIHAIAAPKLAFHDLVIVISFVIRVHSLSTKIGVCVISTSLL
jgi:hypothetical protein